MISFSKPCNINLVYDNGNRADGILYYRALNSFRKQRGYDVI